MNTIICAVNLPWMRRFFKVWRDFFHFSPRFLYRPSYTATKLHKGSFTSTNLLIITLNLTSDHKDSMSLVLLILAEFSGLCWLFGRQPFLPVYDTVVFPATAWKSQQNFWLTDNKTMNVKNKPLIHQWCKNGHSVHNSDTNFVSITES